MRGKAKFLIAAVAVAVSGVGQSATAQTAPTVTVYEGQGLVCSASGLGNCVQDLADPAYQGSAVNPPGSQGLYWPGLGPAARGPFKLDITDAINAGNSFCVSTEGGPGCRLYLAGQLNRGTAAVALGDGAYCGSSKGTGGGSVTPAGGTTSLITDLVWEQSAATILPATAKVGSRTLIGFSSSRGLEAGGNCGAANRNGTTVMPPAATFQFQVEGMSIIF